MKKFCLFLNIVLISLLSSGCASEMKTEPDSVEIKFLESHEQIHVLADGEHFISYLYDTLLMKPVLYPVYSSSNIRVQRLYPLEKEENENHDHPHHVGVFFTYGSDGEVNGNSFWTAQKEQTQINHVAVTKKNVQSGKAVLSTRSHWIGKNGEKVLIEDRKMEFTGNDYERAIDFTFNLKTAGEAVEFKDTKEGMFAIRVAKWLNEDEGTGRYLSSEGDSTSRDIWGKRAKWVRLQGTYRNKKIGIIIMNHPESVNYPTYWHARGYGLFSANPLGQSVFQRGRGGDNPEPLNFTIEKDDKAVFRFKLIIYEGDRNLKDINQMFESYVESRNN